MTDPPHTSQAVWLADGSLSRADLVSARHRRQLHPLDKRNDADKRTPTEKDRGRIQYSGFFQRLAGVTQVMTPTLENTNQHSRLTHSLKVGLVSREIAADLLRRAAGDERLTRQILAWGGLDIAACETAGLAHDIGHPPFGHAAEGPMDQWLLDGGDPDGFEGNAQTLRVVATLDRRRAGDKGLDLTAVTVAALQKYPRQRPPATGQPRVPHSPPKFSVYATEGDLLAFARSALAPDLDEGQQSLEAGIMDLADDITYAAHDLQDFYQAGLLDVGAVTDVLDQGRSDPDSPAAKHGETLRQRFPIFHEDCYDAALKNTATWLETNLGEPYRGAPLELALMRSAFSIRIGDLLKQIEVNPPEPGQPVQPVTPGQQDWHDMQVMKYIAKHVVASPTVSLHEQSQRAALVNLLDGLEGWVGHQGAGPHLPQPLQHYITEGTGVRRAIVDYVCGFTDHQCLRLGRALSGQELPF